LKTDYFGTGFSVSYQNKEVIAVRVGSIGSSSIVSFVKLSNLPTTASGLGSGQVWRDGTTLRIVP
jgi:hypothetical protein